MHKKTGVDGAAPRRWVRGFTLIESLVALALLGLLVALGGPAWTGFLERQRLLGAAGAFADDYHWARHQAVAANRSIQIRFFAAGAGPACYVIFHGERDQCRCGAHGASCTGDGQALRTQVIDPSKGVHIQARQHTLTLNPLRGTVVPGQTIEYTTQNGQALRQLIAGVGRLRTCSPSGRVAHHPSC